MTKRERAQLELMDDLTYFKNLREKALDFTMQMFYDTLIQTLMRKHKNHG